LYKIGIVVGERVNIEQNYINNTEPKDHKRL